MTKVTRKQATVFLTFVDDLERESTTKTECKDVESAKSLVAEIKKAIKLGYGHAKCKAITEGDSV